MEAYRQILVGMGRRVLNAQREQFRIRLQKIGPAIDQTISRVHQLSGYQAIGDLKKAVRQAEQQYNQTREQLTYVKTEYLTLISSRTQLQRDMNTLLQRKHTWLPEDVTNFTNIYAREHALEQQESQLKQRLDDAETRAEYSHKVFMDTLRERYQEEQVWSDWMRGISLVGTVGLMFANVLMSAIVYGFVEPSRRQKLVDQVVERVQDMVVSVPSESVLTERHLPEPVVETGSQELSIVATIPPIVQERLDELETISVQMKQVEQVLSDIRQEAREQQRDAPLAVSTPRNRPDNSLDSWIRDQLPYLYDHPSTCLIIGTLSGTLLTLFFKPS